jgi:hypothetical protein
MSLEPSWRPYPTHGKLAKAQEQELPETAFAFPSARALPLTDEGYVRSAIESFAAVDDVSDADRELAFVNIRRAAQFYRVPMTETDWRQLGSEHVKPGYKSIEERGRL